MLSTHKKALLMLVVGALCGMVWTFWLPSRQSAPLNDYNVLWITAESMKPEHLGAYGYSLPTSPNIDAFAKTGTLFRSCFNPSGWTSENMVSNFTNVYSPLHGVNSREKHVPENWYLPLERLRDLGYRVPYMQGFQQDTDFKYLGFDGAVENIDPAQWLTTHKDSRFFMWFHLLQTHLPYRAPEPHRSLFWRDNLIVNEESRKRIDLVHNNVIIPRGSVAFNKSEDLPAIRALYDAGVHHMDAKFGEIIQALDNLGLRDKTIVIFSADHGEEQLEHGFVGHASTARGGQLHDEITHVPLIVSFPKQLPQGKIITTQVRGMDIMPTIYELLGLPAEDYFQGESLLPVMMSPDTATDRVAYEASSYRGYQEPDPQHIVDYMYAVRTKHWKLIRNVRGDSVKDDLYDLTKDPEELSDVGAAFPDKLREMTAILDGWLRQTKAINVTKEPKPLLATLKSIFASPRKLDHAPTPVITSPAEGSSLSFDSTNGEVVITWEGVGDLTYQVQLSLGFGDQLLETSVDVEGLELSRSFSKSYWEEYIRRYDIARFRVRAYGDGNEWSAWRTIHIR